MQVLSKKDILPNEDANKEIFRNLLLVGSIIFFVGIFLAVLCHIVFPTEGYIQLWIGLIYTVGLFLIIIAFANRASINNLRKKVLNNDYVIFEATLVRERVTVNNAGETPTEHRDYIFEHPQSRSSFAVPSNLFPGYPHVGYSYYVLAIPCFNGVYELMKFLLRKQYAELADEVTENFWDFIPPLRKKYSIYR